jgi:hypothetical protein
MSALSKNYSLLNNIKCFLVLAVFSFAFCRQEWFYPPYYKSPVRAYENFNVYNNRELSTLIVITLIILPYGIYKTGCGFFRKAWV